MTGYVVSIRNIKTREVREWSTDTAWDDLQEYMWQDGNYACDCQRAQFFGGDAEARGVTCGCVLYEVTAVRSKDGTPIDYDEVAQ